MPRNPVVDAWFAEKNHPQEALMQAIRDIILEDPRVEECIKWSHPTFTFNGNICSFTPAKKFASLAFHHGAEIPGRHAHLTGDGPAGRLMKFEDQDALDTTTDELRAIISAWCELKA